jgi:hypothetical protein
MDTQEGRAAYARYLDHVGRDDKVTWVSPTTCYYAFIDTLSALGRLGYHQAVENLRFRWAWIDQVEFAAALLPLTIYYAYMDALLALAEYDEDQEVERLRMRWSDVEAWASAQAVNGEVVRYFGTW